VRGEGVAVVAVEEGSCGGVSCVFIVEAGERHT
jgi:hypothetical protein